MIGHIASAGVIGTTTGNRSREYQRPKHEAFSLISIPNLPGLEIFRFGFSQNQLNREMKGLDPTAVANNADLFGNLFGFSSDKQVKLLLLVSPSYIQFGHVNTIFRIFWMKGAGKVAFAGGVVEEVWKVEKTPGEIVGIVDDIGLTGIAFCGESVRAASAVIPEGKTTREEISTIFRKLAETGVGTGRLSFAFMFACCGRGKRLHKREDFEVAIFRQFFPHTPIQGIFSMGECGTDYLSTGNHTEEAEMPGAPQPFDTTFAYSTVVSVVSMQ